MREERRAVLSLIAAGRISVVEAERLIAAWRGDRELYWLAAAALLLSVLQAAASGVVPGPLAHAFAPGWHWLAQHALTFMGKGLGGLQ